MSVERGDVGLVLESRNYLDLSTDDLRELADDVSTSLADSGVVGLRVTVKADEDLYGAGNIFVDALYVVLPNAEFIKETAFTAAVGLLTRFMRKRYLRKHEGKRPREVVFVDAAEHEILRIKVSPQAAELDIVVPSADESS
jgi:hypothetical protein